MFRKKLKKIFFLQEIFDQNCWIFIDIPDLLSETKINYWFKHLLNCNIWAILVAIIKLINISKEKQISYYLIRYIKQKIMILN